MLFFFKILQRVRRKKLEVNNIFEMWPPLISSVICWGLTRLKLVSDYNGFSQIFTLDIKLSSDSHENMTRIFPDPTGAFPSVSLEWSRTESCLPSLTQKKMAASNRWMFTGAAAVFGSRDWHSLYLLASSVESSSVLLKLCVFWMLSVYLICSEFSSCVSMFVIVHISF